MKTKKGMVTLGDLMSAQGLKMLVLWVFLHLKFHTDEAVCWWISQSESFREKVDPVFPEIRNARARFWSWGQTFQVVEAADTLSFGCRGGRVDEHGLVSEDYERTCAADMFAQICGLNSDAALRAVIAKVVLEDRGGASHPDSLHAVLKKIHRMDDESRPDALEILEWAALAYQAEYEVFCRHEKRREKNPPLTVKQARLYIRAIFGLEKAKGWVSLPHRAAKNEKARKERMMVKLSEDRKLGTQAKYWRTVRCIVQGEKQMVPMVVMETDSLEANKSAIDLGAYIVVIKRSSGNMTVFTDRRQSIDLSTVALALRQEELELMWENGDVLKKPIFQPDQLATRGQVKKWPPGTAYWFLHDVPRAAANQLYNGSESAGAVFPTRMSLETVVTIVTAILGGQFHPKHYRKCLSGKCVGVDCPWFSWNLGRCESAKEQTFAPTRK